MKIPTYEMSNQKLSFPIIKFSLNETVGGLLKQGQLDHEGQYEH